MQWLTMVALGIAYYCNCDMRDNFEVQKCIWHIVFILQRTKQPTYFKLEHSSDTDGSLNALIGTRHFPAGCCQSLTKQGFVCLCF